MPRQKEQTRLKNHQKDWQEDWSVFLEQYKLALTMTDKISDRRGVSNGFFLTLNTFLISVNSFRDSYLLSLMGIIICILWFLLLKTYKNLNKVKFEIIHKLEEELPLNLMQYEWDQLCKNRHKPLTQWEIWIPWVFIGIYFYTCFNAVQ